MAERTPFSSSQNNDSMGFTDMSSSQNNDSMGFTDMSSSQNNDSMGWLLTSMSAYIFKGFNAIFVQKLVISMFVRSYFKLHQSMTRLEPRQTQSWPILNFKVDHTHYGMDKPNLLTFFTCDLFVWSQPFRINVIFQHNTSMFTCVLFSLINQFIIMSKFWPT